MVIVGGGILGTATARDLSNRNSTLKLAIVEKEQSIGKCFINCQILNCFEEMDVYT